MEYTLWMKQGIGLPLLHSIYLSIYSNEWTQGNQSWIKQWWRHLCHLTRSVSFFVYVKCKAAAEQMAFNCNKLAHFENPTMSSSQFLNSHWARQRDDQSHATTCPEELECLIGVFLFRGLLMTSRILSKNLSLIPTQKYAGCWADSRVMLEPTTNTPYSFAWKNHYGISSGFVLLHFGG